MTIDPNVPNPETGNDTTPPGETPPKVPSVTPEPPHVDTTELDTLKAALKKANAEAAQHRHKANELDKLKEQIEAEKLSDKERLEAKLTALQSKYDTTLKENQAIATIAEIRLQAAQLNFDQRAASRLIEETAIERDANGNATNIPDLVKQLVKDYPGLVSGKASTNTGGATNPSRTQSSQMAEVTEDYIAKLTPAIYDALPMEQKRKITEFRQAHTHVFGRRSTF